MESNLHFGTKVVDLRQNQLRKPVESARRSSADDSNASIPIDAPKRVIFVSPALGKQRGRSSGVKSKKRKDGKIKDVRLDILLRTEASQNLPPFPPEFNQAPVYLCHRRYQQAQSLSSGGTFTIEQGHSQFLVAHTALLATSYVECWRIKKIMVWVISEDENPVTCFISPAGTDIDSNCFNEREAVFTCSSRSQAQPGRMEITPHPTSPLGSWHRTSSVNETGNLFTMTAYGSSQNECVTMDIIYEYVLNVTGGLLGYDATAVGGLTAGVLYARNVVYNGSTTAMNVVGVNAF